MIHRTRLRVVGDGRGRFMVELPLQVDGRLLRVVAGTHGDAPVVVLEDGVRSEGQFHADDTFAVMGIRAITGLVAALHTVVGHAFGVQAVAVPAISATEDVDVRDGSEK